MQIIQDEWDPLYGEILLKLQSLYPASAQLSGPRARTHTVCSRRECDPKCNNSNVYLCKYGTVHICSPTRCEYYAQTQSKTCPISGIVHQAVVLSQNTYDKNDSRTWRKESDLGYVRPEGADVSEKKRRNHKHTPHVSQLQQQAEDLIIKLLYSSGRSNCNEAARQHLEEQAKKARQTYVNERFQKRQLPYLTDLMRITATVFSKPPPYLLFTLNNSLVRYYVAVIMQVWALVLKHAVAHKHKVYGDDGIEMLPRIDFESVALATLYAMREGIVFEETIVALPQDLFLQENLPALNDLDTYFYLSQNKVTTGTTLLLNVYNNARNDGATLEEVCLRTSELPLKDEDDGVELISERVRKRAQASPSAEGGGRSAFDSEGGGSPKKILFAPRPKAAGQTTLPGATIEIDD